MASGQGPARPTLGIIGAGRAGSALGLACSDAGYRVVALYSRTPGHAERLAWAVGAGVTGHPAEVVAAAELTLLTVPDPAIPEVSRAVAGAGPAAQGRMAVHCSARLGPDALAALQASGVEAGVLHPLLAMSGPESHTSLRGAHFRVEAGAGLETVLRRLVADLGGRVLTVAPDKRDLYHAAAVLAGNAPLALLARGVELLEQCGVERSVAHDALAALLEAAAHNARKRPAEQALTGPVVRGDREAIAAHLAALEPYPQARELYVHMLDEMEALLASGRSAIRPARLHRVA